MNDSFFFTPPLIRYNTSLHTTILDEYYRVYPYLCAAVKNFVKDHVEAEVVSETIVFH